MPIIEKRKTEFFSLNPYLCKDETEDEFTIYCWDGVDGIHMNSIEEAVSAAESSISNIYWEWEQIDAENEF